VASFLFDAGSRPSAIQSAVIWLGLMDGKYHAHGFFRCVERNDLDSGLKTGCTYTDALRISTFVLFVWLRSAMLQPVSDFECPARVGNVRTEHDA